MFFAEENEKKGNILRRKTFFVEDKENGEGKCYHSGTTNEQTNKERQDYSAKGPWKAEMGNKSVIETRLETMCTRRTMHELGKYGGNSRFYRHLTNRTLKEKTT